MYNRDIDLIDSWLHISLGAITRLYVTLPEWFKLPKSYETEAKSVSMEAFTFDTQHQDVKCQTCCEKYAH